MYGGVIHPAPDPDADHEAVLLQMLDDFLAGALSFEKLGPRFGDYFIDRLPDDALPNEVYEFFCDVHEQLCLWTAREPTPEDRHHGWIDVEEFTNWLAAKLESFPGQ